MTPVLVGIRSDDPPFGELVAEVVQAAGFLVVADGMPNAPDVWLWIGDGQPPAAEGGQVAQPVIRIGGNGADADVAFARPDATDVRSLLRWTADLVGAIRAAGGAPRARPAVTPGAPVAPARGPAPRTLSLIAIAISTGGPPALEVLLRGLHARDLPPILIVQHIPPAFLPQLCGRLHGKTGIPISVVARGERLSPGRAWFAPGDHHVVVHQEGGCLVANHDDSPPRRGHRPAAAVTFESLAALKQPGAAVMMTGMGVDGAAEMVVLRERGWRTFGQDEASCAVYGMPGAARRLGAIELELPLDRLAPAIVSACAEAR
ncbi:MAG: chemotaxis protein CheB [Planctomycetes bacterium]|nr:chemotaxis protein CheB [Planctomycetota bacterium]